MWDSRHNDREDEDRTALPKNGADQWESTLKSR